MRLYPALKHVIPGSYSAEETKLVALYSTSLWYREITLSRKIPRGSNSDQQANLFTGGF